MAETILSTVLPMIIQKLSDEAVKKIGRAKGIHSELKKWERSLSQINNLLNDAAQKEITDKAVKRWLDDLQDLAYDIDDVLDDVATEAVHRELTGAGTSKVIRKLIPTLCTNFCLSSRISDKLDGINTKLQGLLDEKNSLGLEVKDGSPKKMNRIYETCLPDESDIVGRENNKKELLEKLLGGESSNRNISIVPIVGMGGVGKTTLARLLYNERKVKDHFERKAWVCVSDEFDIFKISQVIFENVTGENKEFKDLNVLQLALSDQLSGKLCLLVLDDVWSENFDEWENLTRPFHGCAPGSKVIMTTRKEELLKTIGYDHLNHLQHLSDDDALSLFAQHALGVNDFDLHPTLRSHGEGIVRKCDGLPLALKALGRLLRAKGLDEKEWKDVLNSNIWELREGGGILPALKLSYHDLSAHLKLLFAYCSLFPKDYPFDKEELVLLWMAEGFLGQSTPNKSMEDFGLECFGELLSRSFFQHAPNDESLFVMHDLMNDLAKTISGDFFSRLDIETKKDVWKETCRHMSYVCERYIVSKKFKGVDRAESLRTFLALSLWRNNSRETFYVSNKVMADLLHQFPLLRVLSLSNLSISEVPELIGDMKHLRYLNLSRTQITCIPENVCNLYNLQTLIVVGCHELTKLPHSFLKLKNLRHLDVRDTPRLEKMSVGIDELKNLQTLSKIIIGGDDGFVISKLKSFENLCGIVSIEGLDKVQNTIHVQESNLSEKRLSELKLEWSDVCDNSRNEPLEKEVLNALKPHNDTLKTLAVVSYGGKEYPTWVGDPSFDRLTKVALYGCNNCTFLPPLGQLQTLKALYIQGMKKVKVVGSELLGSIGVAFPSLEILRFEDLLGWEIWSTKSGVVDDVFPRLQELEIRRCPGLVELSLDSLPLLRVLKIEGCGEGVLRSLVDVASSSVTTLSINSISGLTDELWGGVIKHLGAVEDVNIRECNEIRYVWKLEAEASEVLVKLRTLEVRNCSKLVSLGEKEEDNHGSNLTSLTILRIRDCKSMESFHCPNSIEDLYIWACDSMTTVTFPTGGGQKLKTFRIGSCKKLMEKEVGGGGEKSRVFFNTTMPLRQQIEIVGWQNLEPINELRSFKYLTHLTIKDCLNLKSFPGHELPKLNSLTFLVIRNCSNLDVSVSSFLHGLWCPNLRSLEIGGLKKPITKLGLQNFPPSLVDLTLTGETSSASEEEDESDFIEFFRLIPPSLAFLGIIEFKNLKSISMGLEHLTSLQHLYIWNCPKMKDLPETLLPSLLTFTIFRCPKLEERSNGRGSHYWPLISHIPHMLW